MSNELTEIVRDMLARCEVRTLRLARNAVRHCRTGADAVGVLEALIEDAQARMPAVDPNPGGSPDDILETVPC